MPEMVTKELEAAIEAITEGKGFWSHDLQQVYTKVITTMIEKGMDERQALELMQLLHGVSGTIPCFVKPEGFTFTEFEGRLNLMTQRAGFSLPGAGEAFKAAALKLVERGIQHLEVLAIMDSVYEAGTVFHGSFESRYEVDYRLRARGLTDDEAYEFSSALYKLLALPEWSDAVRTEMHL